MIMWVLIIIAVLLIIISLIMCEVPSLRALYLANKIHGLRGLPIVGSVVIIMKTSGPDILDMFEPVLKKYKRLTSFYIAGLIHIMVQEPEDAQIILSSVDHITKGYEYGNVHPWLNEGLLTSSGAKWHARRKLLTPTFHYHILEDALSTMNKKIVKLVQSLNDSCGKCIKLEECITKCTLDIIGETAMGMDLKAQSAEGESYLKAIKSTGESVITRILTVWQYKDWLFKISPNGRKFFKSVKILHQFTDKVIQERKETFESRIVEPEDSTGKKVRRAFLDCLLETQRSQPGLLTDLDIREEVDTFMFEGHDTTSAAISFAIWLLGTHREEQEKVWEELKDIFGDEDREISMSDISKMVQLEKVIKETLRLYPSVPYISRRLTQDCVLEDGTILPETSNVAIVPYFMHRNTRFYPDPEKFDPERFTVDNLVERHPYAYIPFSAGPRNCIGQKFAMLEMKVTLAKILRKLEVTSITKREEFKILPYLIIKPTVPLKVIFSPRDSR